MDATEERKLAQQISACEQEKRWHEMAALCYDAIGRTQKQTYYDRLLVAIENQKRPSELADATMAYMLRFPSARESKYAPWAEAMRAAGRADEAIAQFNLWTASMPAEVAAWNALAGLQSDLKRFADAKVTISKAIETVRDASALQRLRLGLARVYVAMEDVEKAIATYDEAISAAQAIPGASAQEAITELARFLPANRTDAYIATLESRLGDPRKEKNALATILAIVDQRTHPKAIAFRRRSVELEPTRQGFLQLRDLCERRAATNDEIVAIEAMLAQFPDTKTAWQRRLLDLYVATGASIKAIPMIEENIREQTNALAYAQAAAAAVSFGDRGLAVKWLDEARRRSPDNQALAAIARVLMRMDRYEDAMSLTLQMSAGQHLRNEIMAELEKAGKRDLVVAALGKASASQPTNAAPWIDLARFHQRNSDTTNAAAAWKKVVELAPSPESYQYWIYALRSLPDSGALLPATESFFKAYPSAETGKALIPLLVKANRAADAIAVQREVVAMLKTPYEKSAAMVGLVRLLVTEQQYTEARKLIDETLILDSSAAMKDELDKVRAMLDANERHVEFVRRAVEKADLNPRDPTAQRSAAQALRITGNPLRAAGYYRRAMAVEDQTATRWDLAYVLTAARQHRDAIQAYQDLLARDLTAQERDSALKAIAESYDALGEAQSTLKFLAGCVNDIRTPYIKTWATARIQALRTQLERK